MKKIPQEDFNLLKFWLPRFTNIHKPTKKTILEFYDNMNDALDNYEMGRVDQHHPKIIEAYKRKNKRLYNAWLSALGTTFMESRYLK